LANEYRKLRDELSINIPGLDGVEFFAKPADTYIPELKDSVDGVIICQNALDHTPNWCFILSNISSYAKRGSYLYLWTDIQHPIANPVGHFSITPDPIQFSRLIETFGYDIIYVGCNNYSLIHLRQSLYVCIVARKSN
jgi:hypothetical protein